MASLCLTPTGVITRKTLNRKSALAVETKDKKFALMSARKTKASGREVAASTSIASFVRRKSESIMRPSQLALLVPLSDRPQPPSRSWA